MEQKRLLYLVRKFREQTITNEELYALKAYLSEQNLHDTLLQQVLEELASQDLLNDNPPSEISDRMYANILQEVDFKQNSFDPKSKNTQSRRINIRYSVAVAVLLLIASTFIFIKNYYRTSSSETTPLAFTDKQTISPGSSKAVILLDDGSALDLENLAADSLIQFEGYALIKNKDGQLSYIMEDEQTPSPIYNTIITPRGGEYKLNLPDGTQIWVNASSTVKYPLNFAKLSREVELTGEAFFDVKSKTIGKDKLPFIVYVGKQRIEVLGTAFNVNNYTETIETTLVEGLVKLSFDRLEPHYLKPNQQAQYDEDKNNIQINQVDPFYTIAWKNDKFAFDNASIHTVMESIARWYDVTIDYQGDLSSVFFSGTISRYEDFNNILNIIELTGKIKFEVEGRRVVVMK